MPKQPDDVTVTLTLPPWMHERLAALVDEYHADVQAVIMEVLDHVQQGVYRPGAWERHWLCQAYGYDWMVNVERDPDTPVFDRPKKR